MTEVYASTSSLKDSELSEPLLNAAPAMIPAIRINTTKNAIPPAANHFPIFPRAAVAFSMAAVIPCIENFAPLPVV